MTRLAAILERQNLTYTTVATRAHLQPRTVRQLATGETPMDNVTIGTVRRIASALSMPVSALIEPETVHPGDPALSRGERLATAIRAMWSAERRPYFSPVETPESDDISNVTPDDFFADMPTIDARRG